MASHLITLLPCHFLRVAALLAQWRIRGHRRGRAYGNGGSKAICIVLAALMSVLQPSAGSRPSKWGIPLSLSRSASHPRRGHRWQVWNPFGHFDWVGRTECRFGLRNFQANFGTKEESHAIRLFGMKLTDVITLQLQLF